MEGRRYTIKQLPPELRPRERLLEAGPGALSNAELLGILLGIGNREKTAVELASEVISTHGDLFGLHNVTCESQNTNKPGLKFGALLSDGGVGRLELTRA